MTVSIIWLVGGIPPSFLLGFLAYRAFRDWRGVVNNASFNALDRRISLNYLILYFFMWVVAFAFVMLGLWSIAWYTFLADTSEGLRRGVFITVMFMALYAKCGGALWAYYSESRIRTNAEEVARAVVAASDDKSNDREARQNARDLQQDDRASRQDARGSKQSERGTSQDERGSRQDERGGGASRETGTDRIGDDDGRNSE